MKLANGQKKLWIKLSNGNNIVLLLLLLLVYAFQLQGPHLYPKNRDKNCKLFRTGTFVMQDTRFSGLTIVRNDSLQIETSEKLTLTMRIKWLNECEFYLLPIRVDNKEYQNLIGDTMYVQITNVLSDSSYEYSAIRNNDTTRYVMIKRK